MRRVRSVVTRPGALSLLSVVIVVGAVATSCSEDRAPSSRSAGSPPLQRPFSTRISSASVRPGQVVVEPGVAVAQVALSPRYLTWEVAGVETNKVPALMQRDLRTGKDIMLDRGVFPSYGLASTEGWVVYARERASAPNELVAQRHGGSRNVVLSTHLVAPLDSRGNVVAWAEQEGPDHRIVVRDMRSGTEWLAAALPRCSSERCYRIDAVALAGRGVTFVRGAIGSHPSLIGRRAFGDSEPSFVELANDPQPDLRPSSLGALYHWLGQGWFRWDFGRSSPRPTGFAGSSPAPVLRLEGERWFLATDDGECETGIVVRRGTHRSRTVQSSEAILAATPVRGHHDFCLRLTDVAWTGGQVVASWALLPRSAHEHHEDTGLVGAIVAGPGASRGHEHSGGTHHHEP
jgi:hypothetical protein